MATASDGEVVRLAAGGSVRDLAPLLPEGLPLGLRNYWYPVLQSEELPQDRPVGVMALGEALAVWRDASGRACAVRDRCPHRSIKLSVGRILDGDLQCILHGLRFDGRGACSLIPWEPEHTRHHDNLAITSYPVEELGGYVWIYIGDAKAFPPPPLKDEVPEELSKPDEFVWFRMPTEIWNANWLLTVDGSDGFHAVTLHAGSQAVADKTWQGGKAEDAVVPLADRRIKIVRNAHGIRGVSVDKAGAAIHHGHVQKDIRGDRFTLPCIHTNPIVAAPGAAPYAARLWQFPIDEKRTHIARFATFRARTDAERAEAKRVFEEIARPRLVKVSAEDAMAAEAQGDVVAARASEYIMAPDEDVVAIRRLMRRALLAGHEGRRLSVSEGALAYPI